MRGAQGGAWFYRVVKAKLIAAPHDPSSFRSFVIMSMVRTSLNAAYVGEDYG